MQFSRSDADLLGDGNLAPHMPRCFLPEETSESAVRMMFSATNVSGNCGVSQGKNLVFLPSEDVTFPRRRILACGATSLRHPATIASQLGSMERPNDALSFLSVPLSTKRPD